MRASAIRIDLPVSGAVPLSGAGHGATAQEIDGTLEANALRLEQEGRDPVILLSVDALSAGGTIRDRVLAQGIGVDSSRLGVFASHSHSAPALDPLLPALGAVDPHHLDRTTGAIGAALRSLSPDQGRSVNLSHGQTDFAETVYRRRRVRRLPRLRAEVTMMPDEAVAIDRSLRIAVLRDPDGAPIAVLWTLACHPTCYPDKTRVSADFPGVVRARLREEYGDDRLPVLFLQGCTGDIRPALYDKRKTRKARVKSLIYGKTFGPVSHEAWKGWSTRLADAAVQAARNASPERMTSVLAARRELLPLSELNTVEQEGRDLWVQSFDLGGLRITGLSAEPSNAYADAKRWRVGYLDHTVAYLPTEAQWRDGGYEATAFRRNFSLPGDFRPGFEARLRKQIADTEAALGDAE